MSSDGIETEMTGYAVRTKKKKANAVCHGVRKYAAEILGSCFVNKGAVGHVCAVMSNMESNLWFLLQTMLPFQKKERIERHGLIGAINSSRLVELSAPKRSSLPLTKGDIRSFLSLS